jgi:hypothetical protein
MRKGILLVSPLQMACMVFKPVSPQMSFTTTSNRRLSRRKYFCIFLEVSAAVPTKLLL